MEVATSKLNPPCQLQAAAGTLVPIPVHASDGNWERHRTAMKVNEMCKGKLYQYIILASVMS